MRGICRAVERAEGEDMEGNHRAQGMRKTRGVRTVVYLQEGEQTSDYRTTRMGTKDALWLVEEFKHRLISGQLEVEE